MPSALLQAKWRVALWSVALGVIAAIPCGIVSESSTTAGVNQPGSVTKLGTSFDPASALVGFLLGAATGALIGTLWYLPGYGKAAAAALLTAVGGLVGLVVAALVGAQTHIVVTSNSVTADHGAPPGVLAVGFVLGLVTTALTLWGVRHWARGSRADTAVAG
jgi:hypothetical protein